MKAEFEKRNPTPREGYEGVEGQDECQDLFAKEERVGLDGAY